MRFFFCYDKNIQSSKRLRGVRIELESAAHQKW
ncbi:hypothetical protein VII00023_08959 [Vibrio ichthyoenteri ATCC 700023]|uniref:Uncharacterized protein n=1 Tax=Vibrio ichthyoenteri ATCC 700023 TaxID=870968 RepID=F9S591_9VIBR|nr:hypothetical protein VII00023_08959 [Vibrio ichthyoenteri ATCC 700023]